jgi:ferredoxin
MSNVPDLTPPSDADEHLAASGQSDDTALPPPAPDASGARTGSASAGHHDHLTWFNVAPPAESPAQVAAWTPRRGRWAVALERPALAGERLVNRLTSTQFNPLYYTGTIAFLLLLVVGLTGLYLFFFFQYGYDASYNAVARMESQFIARTIRAIHRYASGAVVIVTLLHAYRMLFLEKFRGPRWLAWLTGVVLTAVLWFAGITGYWLIWDERAVLINDAFRRALAALTPWNAPFMVYLSQAGAAGRSWILFLIILAVHVVLFLVAIGFFYLHIVRLRRPKWLPTMPWLVGIGGVLLLAGLLLPVGLLPAGDLSRLPGAITFDPIFLFFLPFPGAGWLWWGLLALGLAATALPWVGRLARRSRAAATPPAQAGFPPAHAGFPPAHAGFPPAHVAAPKVRILTDRCTGCTLCALDCPYGALEMVERDDGRPHKYVAREIVDRCVSCAICVGSCDVLAVTLGEAMPETLLSLVAARAAGAAPMTAVAPAAAIDLDPARVGGRRVVFTCERHAAHGARPYLDGRRTPPDGPVVIVTLPCVGAAPPDLLARALEAGATGVRVVGCPPEDCANREGNTWAEQRLTRQRLPRLRRPYLAAPVVADWLPPDAFGRAFERIAPVAEVAADPVAARRMPRAFAWRPFGAALALLAVALLAQILLTDLPLRAYPDRPAVVQLVSGDLGAAFANLTAGETIDGVYRLELQVDGVERLGRSFTAEALLGRAADEETAFFHELTLPPGEHDVSVRLVGETSGATFTLFNGQIAAVAGHVVQPPLSLDAPMPCPPGRPCAQ